MTDIAYIIGLGCPGADCSNERDAAASLIKELRAEVAALRHLLFLSHGSAEHYLYGDDGQRDCNTCMIDFNTDSPAEIENKIRTHALRKMAIDAARAALKEGK